MHHSTLRLSELPKPPLEKKGWPWFEEGIEPLPIAMADHRWPLITIVTPSYQQGQFIEETIRSVLLQGYPNLEYIIIDGGSTDETLDIIRKYEPYISYWVSEPDRGQGHAVNKGWSRANGSILGWLNSDDLYLPGTLQRVAESFLQDEHLELVAGFVSGQTIDLVEYRRKPPRDFNLEYYLWFSNIGTGQPGIFLKSDLYDQVGAVDENLHYVLDRDYWMRISQLRPDLKYLKMPESLAIAREYVGNKSSSASLKIYFERITLLDKVYSRPDVAPRIKRLKASVYSAAYHALANRLFEERQFKEATKFYFKAIKSKPHTLLKNPKMFKSLVQSFLSQSTE